jgi:hypothetical protein
MIRPPRSGDRRGSRLPAIEILTNRDPCPLKILKYERGLSTQRTAHTENCLGWPSRIFHNPAGTIAFLTITRLSSSFFSTPSCTIVYSFAKE